MSSLVRRGRTLVMGPSGPGKSTLKHTMAGLDTVVIAILGIVNSLALSVIERTREMGLKRRRFWPAPARGDHHHRIRPDGRVRRRLRGRCRGGRRGRDAGGLGVPTMVDVRRQAGQHNTYGPAPSRLFWMDATLDQPDPTTGQCFEVLQRGTLDPVEFGWDAYR